MKKKINMLKSFKIIIFYEDYKILLGFQALEGAFRSKKLNLRKLETNLHILSIWAKHLKSFKIVVCSSTITRRKLILT